MKKSTLFLLASTAGVFFAFRADTQDSLPKHVDLSADKYFPPIFDQGSIGSCDWFAVVYYQMTYLYNKAYDRAAAPDNTFSPQFGYNILNNAASYPFNIRVDDVYKFTIQHGSAVMSEFPYDQNYLPWCTDAVIWKNALRYRIERYSYFTYNNADPGADSSFTDYTAYSNEIRKLLYSGEVVVIQSNTFSCQYTTIGDDTATSEDDPYVGQSIIYSGNNGPDHTVALVGYNDHIWVDLNGDGIVAAGEKGALKIADSYTIGSANHNKGFLWMSYSTVTSSIWLHRVNRMKIRNAYTPKVICKLTLHSAARDKLRFQFGRWGTDSPADIPAANPLVFDPYGPGYGLGAAGVSLIAGGACAFDGGSAAGDGSFSFDLTDIHKGNNSDYWYLKIDNAGADPCVIKEFEIAGVQGGGTVSDAGLPVTISKEETYRFLKFPSVAASPYHGETIKAVKGAMTPPNPVSSELMVPTTRDLAGGTVNVVSLQGRLLLTRKIASETAVTIHMSDFLPGSYILVLLRKNGSLRQVMKIVKM